MISHNRFLALQQELIVAFPDAKDFLKEKIEEYDYHGDDVVPLADRQAAFSDVTWDWTITQIKDNGNRTSLQCPSGGWFCRICWSIGD